MEVRPSALQANGAASAAMGGAYEWIRLPTRVMVFSPVIPPHHIGLAHLLHRVFEPISPHDYCLACFDDTAPTDSLPDRLVALPAQAHRLPGKGGTWRGPQQKGYPLRTVRNLRVITQEIVRRSRLLARVLRQERCGAIIVASGALPDVPAAAVAAHLTGTPLFFHMYDHWRFLDPDRLRQRIASFLEPFIVRQAAGIMCASEFIGRDLTRLYGCEWTLVRNAADDLAVFGPRPTSESWPIDDAEIRIVYTGIIHEAHYDAFHNLLEAIDAPDLQNVCLHIYSGITQEHLESKGFRGRYVVHSFVPAPEVFEVQRRADILLLPLAFNSRFPKLIRDAATSKLGDYLAAGRPMLVHAPPGSYPCWFAAQYDCGVVVDRPSPDELANAIRAIRDDAQLRQRLVQNARTRAEEEFSASAARSAMMSLLQARLGPSPCAS